MIGSWLQQQSARVLVSRRVIQNIFLVKCKSLQYKRSIVASSAQATASHEFHNTKKKLNNSRSSSNSQQLQLHHQHGIQQHQQQQQCRCYGSQVKVELDPNPEEVVATSSIRPYLRTCLRPSNNSDDDNDNQQQLSSADMEFAVTFLGTGGGAPTMHRNGSCTALRLGGQTYLFDVCEGTYRQLQFTRISPMSVTKIFISHLHGDHLFGIVPVIMGIMVANKVAMNAQMDPTVKGGRKRSKFKFGEDSITMEKPTLEIYGPPGLYNYIGMVLSLSCSKLNYLNVKVIELVGCKEERGFGSTSGQRGRRNVFTSHYPEIQVPLLTRKFLEQNDDKTWTIDAPAPVTADTKQTSIGNNGFNRLPNDTNLGTDRRLHIKAAELDHLSGVQTFGYVVEEQPPPGTIDKEKAMALGVMPSRKYGLLKCGISVPTDDETGEVHPSQVLCNVFRPRKFSLLADHRMVPPPMARMCAKSDVLVHEATLSKKDGVQRIKTRGHQNAFNAGVLAKSLGCKVLALNHFGGTASGKSQMTEKLSEARDGNVDASQIICSYDFLEIYVPRGGFDLDKIESSE